MIKINLSALSNTYYFSPDDWGTIIFRLSLALIAGAIVGWERELKNKPAGLRTHMLVSLGSALFTLIPLQTATASNTDAISRVVQGIAAGVGFLGAGEILRDSYSDSRRLQIRGLTSAAAIWLSAALGITAGCGLWRIGLMGAILTLFVLKFVKRFE